MRIRTIVAGSVLALSGGAAAAQGSSADGVLQSFARCRALAAPDARLECFDRAAQALEQAVKARDVTIVDRQDVRSAKRSLFGFTIGRIPLFDGEPGDRAGKRDSFDELETTIAGVREVASGGVEFRLAEGGAVWVTTDPVPFPPRNGAKVRIKRGALGNYFIAFNGARGVRGMRLR